MVFSVLHTIRIVESFHVLTSRRTSVEWQVRKILICYFIFAKINQSVLQNNKFLLKNLTIVPINQKAIGKKLHMYQVYP